MTCAVMLTVGEVWSAVRCGICASRCGVKWWWQADRPRCNAMSDVEYGGPR